jgi:hypothetical protein
MQAYGNEKLLYGFFILLVLNEKIKGPLEKGPVSVDTLSV